MRNFQQENQRLVLEKIAEVLDATDKHHADHLTKSLDRAERIFVAGAGRSKLVGGFLAMRLMHIGYSVNVVGEIATPAIKSGDLFIIISGSGGTEQLVVFANRAQALGASVALITAKPDSAIGKVADQVFQIGLMDSFQKIKGMPMGTVFELSTLCFLEALISQIIWKKNLPESEMKNRHANLE